MIRHAFVLLVAILVLVATGIASAGQYCVIDPPRAASATGTGFYVARPITQRVASSADTSYRLYDPTGTEFRIRGMNTSHPDASGSPAGIGRSGANTARMFLNFANDPAKNWAIMQAVPNVVFIPTNWSTTCQVDPSYLSKAVDQWVAQASTWTQLNSTGLVNIANEWGPSVSNSPTGWRDGYLTAIPRMRAAGYTMTLVIDAGYCGQDAATIVKYGQQLLDADPEHNLLFSVHIYGSFHYPATATWMQDYATAMSQLKATGLPILIGEFGPYMSGNSSQTLVPTAKLIGDAEANGWGWMAWSWDSNNLPNCMADDTSFSATKKCGIYVTDDDLTLWGKTIVPMFQAMGARPANLHP